MADKSDERSEKDALALVRHAGSGVECYAAVWRTQRTRPHAHPEYQLTLTERGTGRMTYRGGRARIPVGCMALFHPGEAHVIENAERREPWHLRVLHLPEQAVERVAAPLLQPAPFRAEAALVAGFEAVWRAAQARGDLTAALAGLVHTLGALPGLEHDADASTRIVRGALTRLAAVLDRAVSLDELAAHVGATPSTLRRAFVAKTGLPPHAWHLQRRIQHGKHLLGQGASGAEVALATGFVDQAHFTRHFTKLVGVSPARYAAAIVR